MEKDSQLSENHKTAKVVPLERFAIYGINYLCIYSQLLAIQLAMLILVYVYAAKVYIIIYTYIECIA